MTLRKEVIFLKNKITDLLAAQIPELSREEISQMIEIPPKQYAEIAEDEPILHPLCNEYARVLA